MAFYLDGYSRIVISNGIPIILYVDESWEHNQLKGVPKHIDNICRDHLGFLNNAKYGIAFLWVNNGNKVVDLWRFSLNLEGNFSGPVSDVIILNGNSRKTDVGIASGDTLVVLGLEEQHRRCLDDMNEYLSSRPEIFPWLVT